MNRRRKYLMIRVIHRAMFGFRARGIFTKKIFSFPTLLRPDRPRSEPAPAVGADVVQQMRNAVLTEGAFKTANHRVGGIRRQQLVAMFTTGAKFEHSVVLASETLVMRQHGV